MNGLQVRFLRCMRDAGAPFLVIGGHAMRALGIDRATFDLDLVTSTDEADANAAYDGLVAFDGRIAGSLTPQQMMLRNKKIPIQSRHGTEVDVLTSVGDLQFADLFGRRLIATVDGIEFAYACAMDQIAIKRISSVSIERDLAAGKVPDAQRQQANAALSKDRADIALLELHITNG